MRGRRCLCLFSRPKHRLPPRTTVGGCASCRDALFVSCRKPLLLGLVCLPFCFDCNSSVLPPSHVAWRGSILVFLCARVGRWWCVNRRLHARCCCLSPLALHVSNAHPPTHLSTHLPTAARGYHRHATWSTKVHALEKHRCSRPPTLSLGGPGCLDNAPLDLGTKYHPLYSRSFDGGRTLGDVRRDGVCSHGHMSVHGTCCVCRAKAMEMRTQRREAMREEENTGRRKEKGRQSKEKGRQSYECPTRTTHTDTHRHTRHLTHTHTHMHRSATHKNHRGISAEWWGGGD